jgi:aminopeptidase N
LKVARDASGKITLTQEHFTVNFPKAPESQWKIPLTYSVAGSSKPVSVLMDSKTLELSDVATDHAVKVNVEGAGNYRVQYDDASWKLLMNELPRLSVPDRVNLLGDAWALAQAGRAPLSFYLELVEKLPTRTELAERDQIRSAFDYIDGLISDVAPREQFQKYARGVLRPSFDEVGWTPQPNESKKIAVLRASLIDALGKYGDTDVIAGCRERFLSFLADPKSLAPDLRPVVFKVVGRYADEKTWSKLHELGQKTTSIEEKQNYYEALSQAMDPKLVERTLQISLTDELPTSRALHLVSRAARDSGHPELAWQFAKAHMKQLLAKTDALTANSYVPGLFGFFSDKARVDELAAFAKSDLPPEAKSSVEKATDEMTFRIDFKNRLTSEISSWATKNPRG